MSVPDWSRVRKLLEEALLHPADERAEFLENACVDEPELRREVESLLAQEGQIDFLEEEPPRRHVRAWCSATSGSSGRLEEARPASSTRRSNRDEASR